MDVGRYRQTWTQVRLWAAVCLAAMTGVGAIGCGTTRLQRATQQMVLSDAVDRAVDQLDFQPLKGRKVYLDTTYIRTVKGVDFVNAPYIISSLRHRLTLDGALLTDNRNEAEVVVEPRVGALGYDGHDVTYGIPPSRLLSTAAGLVPNAPPIPPFPELSIAKRSDEVGIAKINVFAYQRETGEPLRGWKTALAKSSARATWVFGAGPFQSGTIYNNPMFVGQEIHIPRIPAPRLPTPSGLARLISHDEETDEATEEPGDSDTETEEDGAPTESSNEGPPQEKTDAKESGAPKSPSSEDAAEKTPASPKKEEASGSAAKPEGSP